MRPVDRRAVEPGRRPGLETPKAKTQALEPLSEADRRIFAHAASGKASRPDMNHAAQKRSGRQDEGAAADSSPVGGRDPVDPAIVEQNIGGLGFDDAKIPGLADRRLHRLAVELTVGLRPRTSHGRPLGAVQDAELNAGRVGDPSHEPVEGVDLAHEMALAEAADRGIAGHCADRREGMGDEGGLRAHAGGSRRRLAAGMTAADHDYVKGTASIVPPSLIRNILKMFHVKHDLSDQVRLRFASGERPRASRRLRRARMATRLAESHRPNRARTIPRKRE